MRNTVRSGWGLALLLLFFLGFPVRAKDEVPGSLIRLDALGQIHTEAGVFASFSDYVRSDFFRENGRRCLVKRPPIRLLQPGAPGDCSLAQTVIRAEYRPDHTLVMPVVFHIIQHENGAGALTDQQIHDQMRVLNEDFSALWGSPGDNGFNTRVRFVLSGITRTVQNDWFYDLDEMAYKQALARDPERTINVYTNTAGGYLGYSYLPQEAAGTAYDGVVLLYEAVGGRNNGFDIYDQGRTLVHEMGHYLGLLHTFEGGCTNSYDSGDLIVDTNPEAVDHYDCLQTFSCGLPDPIHNYMNYTPDTCMDRFTPEQANRMVCSILTYRPGAFTPEYRITSEVMTGQGWIEPRDKRVMAGMRVAVTPHPDPGYRPVRILDNSRRELPPNKPVVFEALNDNHHLQVWFGNEAPGVTILSPQAGQTVLGSVQVEADLGDDSAVVGAELFVDGLKAGDLQRQTEAVEGDRARWTRVWETKDQTPGPHRLGIQAADEAGALTRREVTVNVGRLNLSLRGERRTAQVWVISQDYGYLVLDADTDGAGVDHYRLLRQTGNQSQVLLQRFSPAEIEAGRVWLDTYLDRGMVYRYVLQACRSDGTVLGSASPLSL